MGRQLRGLFVTAGLVQVDVEVLTSVSTSWAEFNALAIQGQSTAFDLAVEHGDATEVEVAALRADLEARDAAGQFFACSVRVRCSGIKPL
jgi:hypothetical protein